MSKIEDVLVGGSTERPDCPCGAEMQLSKSEPIDQPSGTEIRIYECPVCQHELRLMVWVEPAP